MYDYLDTQGPRKEETFEDRLLAVNNYTRLSPEEKKQYNAEHRSETLSGTFWSKKNIALLVYFLCFCFIFFLVKPLFFVVFVVSFFVVELLFFIIFEIDSIASHGGSRWK